MAGSEEKSTTVDAFDAPDSWMAVASGLAKLQLSSKKSGEGQALRMAFDFQGGGGFMVARKEIPTTLPPTWEFRFRLKGDVPPNRFEFKIVDQTGANVWRWTEEPLKAGPRWREIRIPSGKMPFAWGPAGGGTPTKIGAFEFAISAGSGGAGELFIDNFELIDCGPLRPVSCQASSGHPQSLHSPLIIDPWISAPDDKQPWIELDFGKAREIGGMILHWVPGKARDVSVSIMHGGAWHPSIDLVGVGGLLTPIPLPGREVHRVRLVFAAGAALSRIEWKGTEFSRSDDEFIHAVAEELPPGYFPKCWLRRQTLLTPIGSPEGGPRSMMNEEGQIETDEAGPSLEAFLHDGKRLWTWADATITRSLEKGWMPLPIVRWECGGLILTITGTPCVHGNIHGTRVDYAVENTTGQPVKARLHVAVRPFQATPPWQHYNKLGGKSALSAIEIEGDRCRLNGTRAIVALDPPDWVGAQPFAAGPLVAALASNTPPPSHRVVDPLGLAEAVFTFDLDLAAGVKDSRAIAIPFERTLDPSTIPCTPFAAHQAWHDELGGVHFDVPPDWEDAAHAWRTAAAHILVNREGAALHPGPRRYNRAWIRDGVVMGSALARAGAADAFVEFINWYAPFLRADGFVPCCVDGNGPDWLVEYDAQGQWLQGISECHRFGAGDAFAEALWPSVMSCIAHTRTLRERRPDKGYDTPDKRPFRGLLPESASHEGYLAHPVHSYWDDFWAIRGLLDISRLADHLKRPEKERAAIRALGDAFTVSVTRSLRATMELRDIPYVPGSVEWADFDPSATAVAVMLLDGMDVLPHDGLKDTFDRYLEGFRKKMSGETPWTNYSAYEMRIVSALTRLGRREDAHELLAFLLADRRPKEWNQWPEITWKDPESPGHFGDIPHSWIGAEYVFGFAGLFAYERAADETLVLAAGLPLEWFANGRTNGVKGLVTYYGSLSYSIRLTGKTWHLTLEPLAHTPHGGIEIRLPKAPGVCKILCNGTELDVPDDGVVRWK